MQIVSESERAFGRRRREGQGRWEELSGCPVLLGVTTADKRPPTSYGAPNGGFGNGFGNGNGAPTSNGFGRSSGNGFAGAPSNGYGAPPSNRYGPPTGSYGLDPELVALQENIPGGGVPGEDYPVLSSPPDTGFSCDDQAVAGYYADTAPDASCQVFHICQDRALRRQKDSFLCPNGTIFNQQYLVCDWWFNVDCSQAENFYSVNEQIGVVPSAGYGYGPIANGIANGIVNGNGNGYTNGNGLNGNGRNGNGRNGNNGYGSNGNGLNGNGGNGSNGYGSNGNGLNGNGRNGNGRRNGNGGGNGANGNGRNGNNGYGSNGNGRNGNGAGIFANGNGGNGNGASNGYTAPASPSNSYVLLGVTTADKRPPTSYRAPNGGFGNGAPSNGYGAPPSNRYGPPTGSYGLDPELVALQENIPGGGVPGEDYPVLSSPPDTGFSCDDQAVAGYYADTAPDASCQVFHICQDRALRRQKDSFLCPNGTIFNQQYLVCDWWFNVDCSQAENFYSVNEQIGVVPSAGYGYGPIANGIANGIVNGNGNGYTNGNRLNGNGRNGNGRNGSNGYGSNGNGLNGNGGNGSNGYGSNGNGLNGNGGNGSNGYGSNGNGLNGNGRNGNGRNGSNGYGSNGNGRNGNGGGNGANGNGRNGNNGYGSNGNGRNGNGAGIFANGNGGNGNGASNGYTAPASPSNSYGTPF
nr:pro-resilin-like [Cherax quadricarinatus]